ncbi:MAG: HAMP domain-containing protein [Gammaproteobacteria bacterium]|nr:HAMP domain-containing protein [Gammaproteobacteria bacterium]
MPRSLFGRLVLILVVGLILAQIIGSLLLLRDRDRILQDRLGLNLIQRISGVVRLVEEIPTIDRKRLIQAFHSPGFRVRLGSKAVPPSEDAVPAPRLEGMLRRELPNHDQMIVSVIPMPFAAPRGHRDNMDHRRGPRSRHRRPPRVSGFHAQVRLSDGHWVGFHRPIPEQVLTWPARILGYLGVLLVSIIMLSLLAVRLTTRPLGVLSRAADHLGRDIQSPPLDEKGPSEVTRAARAFNTMQRRLRRYIEDRGEILSAISHDLKTPITRLRLRSEMLSDPELRQKFNRDLDEMEQMVSATLDFMRGTESREKPVLIDLMALLDALAEDMREMGRKVTLEPATPPPYEGRPLALKRCLGNLVENAARYGKEARIRIEDTTSQVTIVIADRGPGVPEAELEALFRPFYRKENSRSRETGGTGLGLGIARNIARAHGGDVKLRSGAAGGMEAVIYLPRNS